MPIISGPVSRPELAGATPSTSWKNSGKNTVAALMPVKASASTAHEMATVGLPNRCSGMTGSATRRSCHRNSGMANRAVSAQPMMNGEFQS